MSAFLLSPPCSSTSLAPFQEWSLSVSRDWADKSFSGSRVSTLEHKCPPGPWHDFTIHGNQDTSPWVRNSKYRGEMIYSSTFISPSSFIQLKSSSVNPGFHWMGWVVPKRMFDTKEKTSPIHHVCTRMCVTNSPLRPFNSRLMRTIHHNQWRGAFGQCGQED